MSITILAIESSCDETSAAVCVDGKILSNIIASQSVHEQYGGVVPELASRAHMQNIVPVVDKALKEAGVTMSDLNAIAFTQAPGLIGSLLVGAQFAKSLALALNIPLIAVHHMQAHVLANLIDDPKPSFPFLCLTVSGGHTQIVQCDSPHEMRIIGETIDDAAGEAFDKSAKMLGLPYPGGPLIDKHAKNGDPNRFKLPEPQIPGLNFSFSGLKTAILYLLQDNTKTDPQFIEKNVDDLCASIQHRIISILMNKMKKASIQTGIKDICIAGGVSANGGLRSALKTMGETQGWNTFIPAFQYCTDNAGMIAITGYFKYLKGDAAALAVSPSARAEW
ncbi:tRNA (adenosine(37)-N6)-threonylcarbamoyltransferase complex transferase subunit TsaD [Pseudoflavitalea sp. G-6-1-2]|uniref:tRNA (adenosine(37)-N6)-threonylcarbamoyltransferase complex transferase subunit TsaD n=1 Tax=Pseudoflavitalea sp. G-6-1-2 TaxID=2728841 RepID=UPI00146D0858|nr:tRNA (adenosine(37)-N6)-threonylcarbamoyltransferase complex transferase subunit TsaD [Pseudoflavitalea sp. G-6-1-2]NML21838.1 tRNA (adenosine(37)-N6)-threonylcarbamoyltransferase complex transferase subunit TsaD [Pseudoflavitalea sp. G-6-1-2]